MEVRRVLFRSTGKTAKLNRTDSSVFSVPPVVKVLFSCTTNAEVPSHAALDRADKSVRATHSRQHIHSSIPAIDADIRFAMVPASMARWSRFGQFPRLLGSRPPIPPI